MLIRGLLIAFLTVFLGFIFYQFGPSFLFYIGLKSQLIISLILFFVFAALLVWGIGLIDYLIYGAYPKNDNRFIG